MACQCHLSVTFPLDPPGQRPLFGSRALLRDACAGLMVVVRPHGYELGDVTEWRGLMGITNPVPACPHLHAEVLM